MNSFKMAYKLLKDNFNNYILYLILISIAIATYYNFVSIQYNKSYIELTEKINSTMVASYTCGFVLIIAMIFFLAYVNNFFLEQRKKEIGLYMLMGITPSKVGKIFGIESVFLGVLAFCIGLPTGIIFSKLFFMLLSSSMKLEEALIVDFSSQSVVQLGLVFGSIIILLAIHNYRIVNKTKLINLFNATKIQSGIPKDNYLKGILGVILIILGYLLALMIKRWKLDLIVDSMCALILVCMGTYMMYKYFFSIVLRRIINSKNMIYQKGRLVVANNLLFRLKDNYSTFAMTAILSAATIASLGVSLSFKSYALQHVKIEAPYSFGYINDNKEIDEQVIKLVEQSQHQLIGTNKVSFFSVCREFEKNDKIYTEEVIFMSLMEFKEVLKFNNYNDENDYLNSMILEENEMLFVNKANELAPVFVQKDKQIEFENYYFKIIEEIQVPLIGNVKQYGNQDIYVVNDKIYNEIAKNKNECILNMCNITLEEQAEELMNKIKLVINNENEVMPYVSQYVWEYYALQTFSFLGCIMTVIFMFSLFSALYFKILSESYKDKKQYGILLRIGMDEKTISKIIHAQVAFTFVVPSMIGIIHSIIAITMVEEIMDASFNIQIIIAILVFVVFMFVFYLSISKKYIKIACDE